MKVLKLSAQEPLQSWTLLEQAVTKYVADAFGWESSGLLAVLQIDPDGHKAPV